MKTLITLIFALFIGITAQAQDTTSEVKVATIEMGIVTETVEEGVSFENNTEVARLYKRSNAKVKRLCLLQLKEAVLNWLNPPNQI